MKIIPVVIVTVLSLTILGCKGQEKNNTKKEEKTTQEPKTASQKTGPQVTSEPTVYKGVTNDSCAAEMAFGSPGSGIDGKAYNKVMEVINSRNLSHTAKNIGREGETRICLPLTELKGAEKEAVLTELKKIAKEGQLVSVSIR